jgi:hypothetical protein
MVNFTFTNIDQLLDPTYGFLSTVQDFERWETVIFRVSASNGLNWNISTAISDPWGNKAFIEFSKLKQTLIDFYIKNNYLSINAEIKLKCPTSMKPMFDPNNKFDSLYVNFYTDKLSTYAKTSFLELTTPIDNKPIKDWIVYINSLYQHWKKKNRL